MGVAKVWSQIFESLGYAISEEQVVLTCLAFSSVCLVHFAMLYERGKAHGAVLWNAQCVGWVVKARSFVQSNLGPSHERPSQRDRGISVNPVSHRFTEVRGVGGPVNEASPSPSSRGAGRRRQRTKRAGPGRQRSRGGSLTSRPQLVAGRWKPYRPPFLATPTTHTYNPNSPLVLGLV